MSHLPQRHHWAEPYADATRCGRSLHRNYKGGLLLALDPGDTDCLRCLKNIAEPWHGTPGGYNNHGCRCPRCTAANTAYQAMWRERHRGMEPPTHGESGYTNYGCRCTICSQAHNRRVRHDRKRRREAA